MFAPWDLGPTVRITAFTLTAFSTCIIALRYYCRLQVVGRLKSYDYIILAALICTWGLCVTNHYQLATGAGTQIPKDFVPPPMTPELIAIINKMLLDSAISWFAYRILYVVCLGLIKISILVFYLTFATSRTFRNLAIFWLVVVALFTVVTGFMNGFECPRDPSVTLDPRIFDPAYASKCIQRPILYYFQAGFNIVSDIAILVLPMPSLLQLRMPTLKRICVITVFSVGFIVPIASALRIWALVVWANSTYDANYKGAYMLFWSQVEINTAIFCASAPSLQPLIKSVFGRFAIFQTGGEYYYYGEEQDTVMDEQVGQRRVNDPTKSSVVEEPAPPGFCTRRITERDLELDQDLEAQERIRDRVRHFASQSSLGDSREPRPSERPKEMLPYG